MVFSTPLFLFLFLPMVLLAYFSSPEKVKNTALLMASLFFYAWGEVFYILVMLFSIITNYLVARSLDRPAPERQRKRLMGLGVLLNIGLLGLFKYGDFIVGNINHVTGLAGLGTFPLPGLHLPLGISFFTFQALSYIVDVYRRQVDASKNLFDVALYISMFPQLIAGPIVRYKSIAEAIGHRVHEMGAVASGIRRFIMGLAKKMLIANALGRVADSIFALPAGDLALDIAWLGALCYALQIYYDFSGYSDMAIGLGRIFGFSFPENFNYPYISKSLQEFWRRWHITLSTWFRDYLYIPLGGNRVGRVRNYMNLCVVFFLCGLWHGASWNFVVWGMIHGIFLVIERMGFSRVLQRLWPPLQRLYTLAVVLMAWVFFRAETMAEACTYLKTMFGLMGPVHTYSIRHFMSNEAVGALLLGIILGMPVYHYLKERIQALPHLRHAMVPMHFTGFCILLLLSLLKVASATYNPFIYFRF